ncbi:MAG: aldo/keto reductase [Verrucomicrobiota bacterium]|jgi:aryl-alcohol dehydrogenase-like predicted oxidoreductase
MKRREFLKSITIATVGFPIVLSAQDRPLIPVPGKPSVPRRILGKTGVEVSALALGGVVGMQLAPGPDHDPVALAEAALNLGINYFDTAPGYADGQSEKNYGQVLARRRKEVFQATKLDARSYDGAMRDIEGSLKRLQTDHVDLLQIHGVTAQEDIPAWEKPDGVLTALRKLRDQKVTRFIGVTGHESAEKLQAAIERYDFDTLLTTLNPVARRQPFRENLLPLANSKKMGVIAMKVMGGGVGCLASGNPFKQTAKWYYDQTDHQQLSESLVRYTLGLPVSVAVIGVASVDQLKSNLEAASNKSPMAAAERAELEKAIA